MDQLREQLMQSYFNQLSEGMQNMTPERMAQMKDMLNELNQMLEQRERGEEPDFDGLHGAPRRLLPRQPADPRRAARADGAVDGADAAAAELDDARAARPAAGAVGVAARGHGPALAGRPALPQPAAGVPRTCRGSGRRTSAATTRCSSARCRACSTRSATSTTLENLMRSATQPGELAEVDLDRARELLGDDAARSLDRLRELSQDAGGGGAHRAARGPARAHAHGHPGHRATRRSRDLYRKLVKDRAGRHELERTGVGNEHAHEHKPYEFGDPFHLNVQETVKNAIWRPGPARRCGCRRRTSRSSAPRCSPARRPCCSSTCRCRCRCATTSCRRRRSRWRCTRSSPASSHATTSGSCRSVASPAR